MLFLATAATLQTANRHVWVRLTGSAPTMRKACPGILSSEFAPEMKIVSIFYSIFVTVNDKKDFMFSNSLHFTKYRLIFFCEFHQNFLKEYHILIFLECGDEPHLRVNDTSDETLMTTQALDINSTCRYTTFFENDLDILDQVTVKVTAKTLVNATVYVYLYTNSLKSFQRVNKLGRFAYFKESLIFRKK